MSATETITLTAEQVRAEALAAIELDDDRLATHLTATYT
jgi:hypothetical protein